MKTALLLSAVMAFGASFAGEISVESRNLVGALDVSMSTDMKQKLVSVPFEGYEENGKVAVTDMVKTSQLANGSKIYVPDGDGRYYTWILQNSVWEKGKVVNIDRSGSVTTESESDGMGVLSRGDSFWVEPAKGSVANAKIYLLGEGNVQAGTSKVVNGWNLIGNAGIHGSTISPTGGADDQIVVQNGGQYTYYRFIKNFWCRAEGAVIKKADITIAPGQGVWYQRKSSEELEIKW